MPRTSSSNTQPHNRTRPAKRVSRVTPAVDPSFCELDLPKMLMWRRYAPPRKNTTSANHVKVSKYIKYESDHFHRYALQNAQEPPCGPQRWLLAFGRDFAGYAAASFTMSASSSICPVILAST